MKHHRFDQLVCIADLEECREFEISRYWFQPHIWSYLVLQSLKNCILIRIHGRDWAISINKNEIVKWAPHIGWSLGTMLDRREQSINIGIEGYEEFWWNHQIKPQILLHVEMFVLVLNVCLCIRVGVWHASFQKCDVFYTGIILLG